jgi:hypothetical protein
MTEKGQEPQYCRSAIIQKNEHRFELNGTQKKIGIIHHSAVLDVVEAHLQEVL